jgi:hypothetical protein
MKPGWKTSEYWCTVAAQAVGLLMASDVFASGSIPAKIAGLAAMVLASMGYSYSRGQAKYGAGK